MFLLIQMPSSGASGGRPWRNAPSRLSPSSSLPPCPPAERGTVRPGLVTQGLGGWGEGSGERRGTLRDSFLPQHFVSHSTNTADCVLGTAVCEVVSLRTAQDPEPPEKPPTARFYVAKRLGFQWKGQPGSGAAGETKNCGKLPFLLSLLEDVQQTELEAKQTVTGWDLRDKS